MLLLIPTAGAVYDVVSGIASNGTPFTTSASYEELHNITLATGTGTTFMKASWEAGMNFTVPLYGRFMRDGVSLGRFNLTQSVYIQVGSYEIAFNETAGTHQYGWEVYSNKKGTIYSRNFSAVFLKNGTYGTGTGGSGNITSITGAPAGVLTCTGTDDITCTVTQAATGASGYLSSTDWNTFNSKLTNATAQITRSQVTGQEGVDTGQNSTSTALQVNDTYFNGSVFPNSTNFRNDSISGKLDTSTYSGNFPNSSLVNYLLTSFYNGNYPNLTVSGNLANWNATYNSSYHTLITNAPNTTVAGAVNCSALGTDYVSRFNGTTWACYQDQTSAFSIRADGGTEITGAAELISGSGINIVTNGSRLEISSPAAGVTNASVNPYSVNATNLTGSINQSVITALPESRLSLNYATHAQNHSLNGTDHTGYLNYSRLMSIMLNLSATTNLTGSLADVYITSYTIWNNKIDTVGGSGPIIITESPANTATVSINKASRTVDGYLDYTNFTIFSDTNSTLASKMSNPATASLNMNNYSLTNVGTPFCSGVSYCIYNQSGTIIAVNGTTQNVDFSGTDAYSVIQNSINNSNGIYIKGGRYIVNVGLKVKTNTHIIGEGSATILNAGTGVATLITNFNTTTGNTRILLEKFKIDMGSQAFNQTGIDLINVTDSVVDNMIIMNVSGSDANLGMGIAIGDGSMRNVVTNNMVYNYTHYGIALYISYNNTISENNIYSGGRHGIGIGGGDYNIVVNNQISGMLQDGIYTDTRSNNVPEYNIISGNIITNIEDQNSVGNAINSWTGNNNIISNNNIKNTYKHAVLIKGNYNLIIGNSILNASTNYTNGACISNDGSHNNIISNYMSTCNDYGIYTGGAFTSIKSNTLEYIHRNGIVIWNTNNNTVIDNSMFTVGTDVTNTYDGIQIGGTSYNNTVYDNIIVSSDLKYGINEQNTANYNIIRGNNLKNSYVTAAVNKSGLNSVFINNYGTSPFDFGIYTTAPTAFGAGDTYFNTTVNIPQIYTTFWNYLLMPDKVFGTGVTNNNNGSITITDSTYNTSYTYGGFDVPFQNGSNNLTLESSYGQAKYNGIITNLAALSVQTGSINITLSNKTLGTFICSVVITSGTDATTQCTPYAFNRGDWLNTSIISVTGIRQVTLGVQTLRS